MARRVDTIEAYDEPAYDEPRRRSRKVTAFLTLLALVAVAYAAVRIASVESNAFLVGAMALTPYAAAGSLLLSIVILACRRKLLAFLVFVVTISLGALLGPRFLSEEQPEADGPRLRVMAANLYLGLGDPRAIVDLVRRQQVDVLVLPELTPGAESALDSAGLAELLPYRVSDPRPGGGGTGIVSKIPLRQIILVPESTMSQPSAVIDLPGRDDVEIVAVHVQPPVSQAKVDTWRRELAALPRPEKDARLRILAGDFNASLDHAAFRTLVDHGYADAAEATGDGLVPTWSSWPTGPPITIDHIVADERIAVSGFSVFDIPGSDHEAILAELVLP